MSETDDRHLGNLQAVAEHLARESVAGGERPAEEESPHSSRLLRWGWIGAALAFVLTKGKLLVGLLKFLKLQTLVSMLVAVWLYAQFWGLPFAAGFVLLIFVHELGHAIVLRQQGIAAGAPVFIPFVGAVIAMKGLPRDAYMEALVALGGPILGSLGALACLIAGAWTGSAFWYALASTGFLINLFNLLPVSPLDGGRIVGVISRWIWVVGYAVGIGLLVVTRSPILFLILLLGLFSLGRAIRGPREGYYEVAAAKRAAIGLTYFGLAGALALGMWAAERPLADALPTQGGAPLAAEGADV